jgi:hypothetical protein
MKPGFSSERSARQALGTIPHALKPLFDFRDFEFLPAPKRGEWLEEHPESGQTYAQFTTCNGRLTASQKTIYIQPLQSIPEELANYLREICTAFFIGTRVVVKAPIDLDALGVPSRMNDYGLQYHAERIIDAMKLPKTPSV